MIPELAGRTVLITGASRGIGAATAETLARNGVARLLLHYNSCREGAEAVAEKCRSLGAETELLHADLATDAGMTEICAALRGREIDILINNAGHLVQRAKLAEFTQELFDRVMNLNAKSLYFITQAVRRR